MIIFETKKQEDEFNRIDPRLQAEAFMVEGFIQFYFGLDMFITHIEREDEQQDEIYKDNPEYKIKPWPSVHQSRPCRGIDFRSYTFKKEQREGLLLFVNIHLPYGKEGHFTLKWHDVGQGEHFHIQVNGLDKTELLK
jgi:hypothetical protein